MLTTVGILLPLLAPAQEPSSVPGAYRGPADRNLLPANTLRAEGGPASTLLWDLQGGWDRWEFWYERERDLLHRGEPDFPATAVDDEGSYGDHSWSLRRDELIMTSMPLLLEALTDSSPALREAAALSLGRIGYPASGSFLERATKDPVESVRQAAYMGLGLLGTEEAGKTLRSVFRTSEEDSTRAFAALGLGLSGRTEAGEELRSFLNRTYAARNWKAQEDVVVAALLAAGVHGSRELVPTVTKLTEVLRGEGGDVRLLTTALQTLGAMRDPQARPLLQEVLEGQRPELAEAAAQALGRLGDRAAVPALRARLETTHEPRLKAATFLALGRLGGEDAAKALKELAPKRQEEESVRSAHVLARGMIQASGAYPQLLSTLVHGSKVDRVPKADGELRRDEDALRGAAALALGLYGNPAAAARLGDTLQDKSQDPALRGYVATGLGLLQSNKAVELLLVLAEDPTLASATRRGLATGLGLAGRETTSTRLVRLLIEDEDDSVRWTAARALASTRSAAALETLSASLGTALAEEQVDPRTAHLVLGLGFLGDRHEGATIGSLVSGMDLREAPALIDALRAY